MFYRQMKKKTDEKEAGPNAYPWSRQHLTETLQDLLTYSLIGLSQLVRAGQKKGLPASAGVFTARAATATSSEWLIDPYQIIELIQQAVVIRDRLREQVHSMAGEVRLPKGPADFEPATTIPGLLSQADQILPHSLPSQSRDTNSLGYLLLSGIRGLAAYAAHAHLLGVENESVFTSLQNGLAAIHRNDPDPDDWTARAEACGCSAAKIMGLLDQACIRHYGQPFSVRVPLGARKGRAILVAGHNFRDLEALLRQAKGRGVHIYTYGEMLEAHQYPRFRQFRELAGHYEPGESSPMEDFFRFPGAVLLTGGGPVPNITGKISNLFTSGPLARPGVFHIMNRKFSRVIDHALAMEGFLKEEDQGKAEVGNDLKPFTAQADHISSKMKKGDIRRIFLVAECSRTNPWQTDGKWLPRIPEDAMAVFITCRDIGVSFHDSDLFPDTSLTKMIGQCRDPRQVVRVIRTLSDLLGAPASSLPVSLFFSWPGQKSMGVVMALFSLGLKEICLGPALPEGITPGILEMLGNRYGILAADRER